MSAPDNDNEVQEEPSARESELVWRTPKTTHDRIQNLMQFFEARAGIRILRVAGLVLGFILLAAYFDSRNNHVLSNRYALESAQLARHLAAWKGYTTYSIRPAAIGLLRRAAPTNSPFVLTQPVPDLSIAPGYPFLLACLMKVLPFRFGANPGQSWPWQPDLLIIAFNQFLLFAAVLLLFQIARRMFDSRVAWVSAILFASGESFWKFSVSGLSTLLLLLIFLLLAWCLLFLEERERRDGSPTSGKSLAAAAAAGALLGFGALSRYAFGLLILPVLLFIWVFCSRQRGKLCSAAAVSFFLVLGPWIARNFAISHTPFGTAGYAMLENARPGEEDRAERAFDPISAGLGLLTPRDLFNKFFANESKIISDDLPHLGGNWAWSFFLCGLLLTFRSITLQRLRWFLLWSLLLMAVAQALGQTYLSLESPEINSENLLIILAPLILVFGVGFFFTLFDQMALPEKWLGNLAIALFVAAMCAPLLLNLASRPVRDAATERAPLQIQKTAGMMAPDEWMMSDVPWAVAWYGDRPCAWLTLDDAGEFDRLNELKPVNALYLTQRTTDLPFLSQVFDARQGWGSFLLESLPLSAWPHSHVPANFPLTASSLGYIPSQLFVSDKVRWKSKSAR